MKFKALRYKAEPKEFVEISNFGGTYMLFTSELPKPQPVTATMEGLKAYYTEYCPLPPEINLDDFELVEYEAFEVNTVGADIRNKLSPCLNLLALLQLYFNEFNTDKKNKLLGFIDKEMKKVMKILNILLIYCNNFIYLSYNQIR